MTNLIYENEALRIEHEYETAFLIQKSSNEILLQADFYGDPTCGLIDEHSEWAIIVGSNLVLWKPSLVQKLETNEFKNIYSLRLKNKDVVEILTDPFDANSAIWELDIQTCNLKKIAKFEKYLGKEYSASINW